MPQALCRAKKRTGVNQSEGFTLIEMVLVIVILGLLATIVLTAVQSLESTSSITSCKSNYKIVETAQEAYRAQTGKYATSLDDFLTTTTGMTGQPVGPWLKEIPSASSYSIGIAPDGSITVASNNPAHGPVPGNGNCSYA